MSSATKIVITLLMFGTVMLADRLNQRVEIMFDPERDGPIRVEKASLYPTIGTLNMQCLNCSGSGTASSGTATWQVAQ